MMISTAAVLTAPAANGSAKNDAQLLGKLVKLWTVHNKRGLDVRLETGRFLNDRLGEPTKRLERGPAVLKQAAKKLHIAESELNRMRWYAYFSKDGESFWGETPPGKRSWTKFKEILPSLKPRAEGNKGGKRSSGDKKCVAVPEDGVLGLISSTALRLRNGNFRVAETEKDELIGRLREFVDAVSSLSGIRFHVETEQEVTGGHGPNKALAQPSCEPALSQCLMDTAAV